MKSPESIQLLDYARVIRRRWRLVAFAVFVCVVVALGLSLSSEKQYDATAQLLLRSAEPINSLLQPGSSSGSNDPERDINTEVGLIKVGPTADTVIRQLHLDRSRKALLDEIDVSAGSTSDIVELRARDADPALAARIANAFAESYVQFRISSARQRYRAAAELARRQLQTLSPDQRRTVQGRELEGRERELQILSALQTGGVELVRRASIPTGASRPRPKLSAAIAAMLGLLLGVGAALPLNLVDVRFKTEREVEEFFALPTLATIPRPARRSRALDDPGQREAFGLLATTLRLEDLEESGTVIMVTSPSPADGKTSVTIGLARAYARQGLGVVIVECDLRRPALARYVDVSMSGGVADVLKGHSLREELLWLDVETLTPLERSGGIGGLGVLPAGAAAENPQSTMANPALARIIETARSMADVVVVDSAPIGTVNDPAMLAPVVDQIVLVARLNKTPKDACERAIRMLSNIDATVSGLVITDVERSERHSYYYYGTESEPAMTVGARIKRGRAD